MKFANEYATKYVESNQFIYRDSLAKLDYVLQFAIFESLTNENKLRIFNEKVDFLVNGSNLNENEKIALLELKNLDESVYKNNENTNLIIDNWISNAKKRLGWDDETIFKHTGTWLIESELQAMAESYSTAFGGPNSCTCSYDIACVWSGSSCSNNGCQKIPLQDVDFWEIVHVLVHVERQKFIVHQTKILAVLVA